MVTYSSGVLVFDFLPIGLLLAAVGYILFLAVHNLLLHPLRSYPGPKLWAVSYLPRAYHGVLGTLDTTLLKLHQKYGVCIRTAPNDLSYVTGQAWKDIYAHQHGRPELPKDPARTSVEPNGAPSIISAGKEDHSRHRKLFSHAFSEKGIREQEPRINEYVELLMDRLKAAARDNTSQDIVDWLNRTTFDIIGDLAFGESFHGLRDRRTHEWIGAIWGFLRYRILSFEFETYGIGFLMQYVIPKDMAVGLKMHYEYAVEKVNTRSKLGGNRGDFWDKVTLKNEQNNADVEGMSMGEMSNNASLLVLAGSETTATLLSGATWLLLTNPKHLEGLTSDIRASYASNDEIRLLNVNRSEYLLAVLEESLRLYPPAPGLISRIATKGGVIVNGQFVPENTTLHIAQHAANRLELNFHRPTEFLPERWLKERDPAFDQDKRDVLQPFSVGPRNCIGRNLAYAEMRLILTKLLWNFDLSLDEERMRRDGTPDWLKQRSFALWEKKPLWVTLTPRDF